jgi:hypothetical protein
MMLDTLVETTFEEYRMALYYRGNITTKDHALGGQARKSTKDIKIGTLELWNDGIMEKDKGRGFEIKGMYRKRLRFFVDCMALGSEEFIRQQIQQVRDRGEYLRRVNPIRHLEGLHVTLREQRGHAVEY